MKLSQSAHAAKEYSKAPPEIVGFVETSRGVLSQPRTALLLGEPRSGKTTTALQFQAPVS